MDTRDIIVHYFSIIAYGFHFRLWVGVCPVAGPHTWFCRVAGQRTFSFGFGSGEPDRPIMSQVYHDGMYSLFIENRVKNSQDEIAKEDGHSPSQQGYSFRHDPETSPFKTGFRFQKFYRTSDVLVHLPTMTLRVSNRGQKKGTFEK